MTGGSVATDGKPEGGDKAKREKKVYDMPGQTKETPDEVRSHSAPDAVAWCTQ